MNILVTGGAGFIGSHLCETLVGAGHKVICVDNFNDYYNPDRKRRNISALLSNPLFVLCESDIRDNGLKDIFIKEKIDKVIHLAAMAGIRYSIRSPGLYFDVNVLGTMALLKLCVEFKIKQFVFCSSSSVYGNNPNLPLNESYELNPLSPYASTKVMGEGICRFFSDYNGLDVICLRFFTVYGPRGRPDMAVYKFVKAIDEGKEITVYDGGELTRDFTYVKDIVSGIVKSLFVQKRFEIINLGNLNAVKISRLIEIIEQKLGKKAVRINAPKMSGEAVNTLADITKAKEILGYQPSTNINEGIRYFIEWYEDEEKNKGC